MTSIPTPRRAEAAGAEVTDATNHSMGNADTPQSTSVPAAGFSASRSRTLILATGRDGCHQNWVIIRVLDPSAIHQPSRHREHRRYGEAYGRR